MAPRPLAVVTGASSGIGLELAKVLAAEGHDLVIASDNRAKLEAAAQEIRKSDGSAAIEIVEADLSQRDGPHKLHDGVQRLGRPVDVLVNNAGIGVWGQFATQTDLDAELAIIQVNIASVVAVTKLFVNDMVRRGQGRILITASEAAIAPTSLLAVYGASKAFDYSFALALRDELTNTGVTVTALLPGATKTNFFNRAGAAHTKTAREGLADPAQIARDGYAALMKGDDHVVTPFKERAKVLLAKVVPDAMTVQRVE
jgi:uncharacterized protein